MKGNKILSFLFNFSSIFYRYNDLSELLDDNFKIENDLCNLIE